MRKVKSIKLKLTLAKQLTQILIMKKDHELFISPFIINHIWEGAIAIGVSKNLMIIGIR